MFNVLPDNLIIQNIDKIPCDIVFLKPQNLDAIVPYQSNNSESNFSSVSDDGSDDESLNEYTKQFLIKDGLCDVKKQHLKTLNNNSILTNLNELEEMNESWKIVLWLNLDLQKNC